MYRLSKTLFDTPESSTRVLIFFYNLQFNNKENTESKKLITEGIRGWRNIGVELLEMWR